MFVSKVTVSLRKTSAYYSSLSLVKFVVSEDPKYAEQSSYSSSPNAWIVGKDENTNTFAFEEVSYGIYINHH